ncbi:fatty-acid amide hydrolase 2-like isoform X2 [Dysidea avara]
MPLFISVTLLLWKVYCILRFFGGIMFFWRRKNSLVQAKQWNNPSQVKLLVLSAKQAAVQIHSRQLTSQELVKCYIDRMKAINPYLNAAVCYRFEEAMNQAQEVDRILDGQTIPPEYSPEKKPLLGVPFTVKESHSLMGMPHTGGLYKRKGTTASVDSPVIRRLKDAGGIPIASTNCSELCMWYESSNNVYGTTNNPYNVNCMVGGSSGGEGSINAAACSVFGIGGDIGGSVRMPCFFCGIFGHKHSPHLTPGGNEFPPTSGDARSYVARSPMCRYSIDLPFVLDIMAGNAIEGSSSLTSKVASVDITKLSFFSIANDGGSWYASPVEQQLVDAQSEVVDHLRSHYKVDVLETKLQKLQYSLGVWLTAINENKSSHPFCEYMANLEGSVNPFWEFCKWLVGKSLHTLPCIGLGAIEKLTTFTKSKVKSEKVKAITQCLKTELEDLLGPNGILLYPSHPNVAPPHHKAIYMPFNFAYTAVFNILGFPATQIPLGLNHQGLPLGVQIVSTTGNDHLTIAVVVELERTMSKCGWVCPPKYLLK